MPTVDKEVNPRFEKTYKVYKHVFPNGKVYVGITSQPLTCRWRSGKGYGNNPYITRAIQKYGWDNIKHYVVKGDFTLDEANAYEKALIAKYQSNNPKFGYNLTSGGDGCPGLSWSHTEESKRKISAANKGKVRTKEMREHLSRVKKGKKLSPEAIAHIAAGHIGLTHTEEYKKQMRETSKRYKRDFSGKFVRG